MSIVVLTSVVFLSACTSNGSADTTPVVTPPTSQTTDTGSTNTGTVNTGSSENSGSTATGEHQSSLVETLTGAHEEYYPIFDGTGTRMIEAIHAQGVPTKVSFINSSAKSMKVDITFPEGTGGNLRWSQVVMPDGTMDGPFGQHVGYNLTQQGGYTLIFSENQMAGDPWSGRANIQITLQDTVYPQGVVMLP